MIKISVGQALLLLIEKNSNNEELKKLYLSGAVNAQARASIARWLKDPLLQSYEVSFDPYVINQDPVRRYFETRLSYQSMIYSVNKLPRRILDDLHVNLASLHSEHSLRYELDKLHRVINGERIGDAYSDYFRYIETGRIYRNLGIEIREKIRLILAIFYLSWKACQYFSDIIPLDIYDNGDNYFCDEARGREEKESHSKQVSQAYGVMKSTMPIPYYDSICYSERPSKSARMTDLFKFDMSAKWPQYHFSFLVYPFSTSISGTMLCQLRVFKYLLNESTQHPFFKPSVFARIITAMIGVRSYYSGGHTLFEFVSPLALDEIQTAFAPLKFFKKINLESLFYDKNTYFFNKVLEETICYNNQIILRAKIHEELSEKNIPPALNATTSIAQSTIRIQPKPLVPDSRFSINGLSIFNLKSQRNQSLSMNKKMNLFGQFKSRSAVKKELLQDGMDKAFRLN